MENKRHIPRFVYLILGVILLCAFFLFPTMARSYVSSSLAKYRAQFKLWIIPMPDEMDEITSYSVGDISRISCYSGEAYLLAGTNLDIKDIQGFYGEYFSRQDWNIEISPDSSPYSFFDATSKQKAYSGRAVEGFTIQKCDKECLLNYEFPDEAIKEATKYKNVYALHTWFIPYEIRRIPCWCCSGG